MDRECFRRHIAHAVERYGGENNEHSTENVLLARKLGSAIGCERTWHMLMPRLQYHEQREESRDAATLLFLILELVMAVTGRDCDYQIMERVHQLNEYPVDPPSIGESFEIVPQHDELADEPVYNTQYLQHHLCALIHFLNNSTNRSLCVLT